MSNAKDLDTLIHTVNDDVRSVWDHQFPGSFNATNTAYFWEEYEDRDPLQDTADYALRGGWIVSGDIDSNVTEITPGALSLDYLMHAGRICG